MIEKKLKVKQGYILKTIHAPADFLKPFTDSSLVISAKAKHFNQIHWFVQNQEALKNNIDKVFALLSDDIICWCYYPKGSSKIKTDLTRDKGWDLLLVKNIQWLSLVSFNDTWSAFSFRLRNESENIITKPSKPKPILQYIDAQNRQIILPDDLKNLLAKHSKEFYFFENLSFTNKKEYVEWIVTAKKEETRTTRLTETIERLKKGWKNPANR